MKPPPGLRAFRVTAEGREVFVMVLERRRPGEELLSPAELAVIELVKQGLSNAAIARSRATSERTVANQIASAYRKLGVRGRAELT